MQIVLLLTAEQAALVRGPSDIDPTAVLDPVALADGRFALPASVLDDPAHESLHQMLGGLPWASISEADLARQRPRNRFLRLVRRFAELSGRRRQCPTSASSAGRWPATSRASAWPTTPPARRDRWCNE